MTFFERRAEPNPNPPLVPTRIVVAPAGGTIRSRVPYEEYAALPGVNITTLKELKRSAQHYAYRLQTPRESDALTLGSATHVAILEPDRFERVYCVWGERTESGNLRPRKSKDYDAFLARNPGRIVLTEDEHALAIGMRNAVRANPAAMRYLETGEPEVTMEWKDSVSGHACRGRLDWLTVVEGRRTLVGLKTARDCRHFVFGNQAAKLGYHLQWAFYRDGDETITGKAARVVEIVVESAPPHAVAVYFIPPEIIEQGRAEYRELLERLTICERRDEWPGPVEDEESLSLPSWVYEADTDVSDLGLE